MRLYRDPQIPLTRRCDRRPGGSADQQALWTSSGTRSRAKTMELWVTESAAALVRERVEVATFRLQETRVYKTRDHVENSLPGLRIVAAGLKEGVQIERLAAHLGMPGVPWKVTTPA